MENVDNKKTIFLLCLSIVIVIIATASVTFAYLSVGAVQEQANVLNSACFDVSFTEANLINVTGYPMSNETGLKLAPYTMTVTNTCGMETNYKVLLNVLKGSSATLFPLINYSTDGTTFAKLSNLGTFSVPSELIKDQNNVDKTYVLIDGESIGAAGSTTATKTHELRLWIDESAENNIMGQKFQAQISVYSGDVPIS